MWKKMSKKEGDPSFSDLRQKDFSREGKKNWKKCLVSSTFRVLSERYCVQYSATSSWMTFRMAEVISVTRETRRRIQFTRCGIVAFGHAKRRNRATQLGLTAGSNWRPHSLFYLKKGKKEKQKMRSSRRQIERVKETKTNSKENGWVTAQLLLPCRMVAWAWRSVTRVARLSAVARKSIIVGPHKLGPSASSGRRLEPLWICLVYSFG